MIIGLWNCAQKQEYIKWMPTVEYCLIQKNFLFIINYRISFGIRELKRTPFRKRYPSETRSSDEFSFEKTHFVWSIRNEKKKLHAHSSVKNCSVPKCRYRRVFDLQRTKYHWGDRSEIVRNRHRRHSVAPKTYFRWLNWKKKLVYY